MNDPKVAPVEAQAVPDQPVASDKDRIDAGLRQIWSGFDFWLASEKSLARTVWLYAEQSVRPTPAAADLHQQIMNLPVHDTDMAGFSEGERACYRAGHRDARHAAAQLVAASPAAAAGVPTGRALPKPSTEEVSKALDAMLAEYDFPCNSKNAARAGWEAANRWLLAASPVAPVGAPTDTQLIDMLRAESMDLRTTVLPTGQGDADVGWQVIDFHMAEPQERVVAEAFHDDPREALRQAWVNLVAKRVMDGPRPGCELATDATKQIGEHSVHLGGGLIEQDFRMRPASSEAAPVAWLRAESSTEAWSSWSLQPPGADNAIPVFASSSEAAPKQPDSDSVHPAMSTSSVPTAAPLLSSRETDRSELPRCVGALERIAGFRLSQFMGPHDMAMECVTVARDAIAKERQ